MSDHGMSFPFSKATVYFNGTRSPVLLRWPGMGGPQLREEFVSSVDLMPTLLELLKVPAPAGLDGRSWLPLLRGEKQPDRDHVFTNVNSVSSGIYFPQRCVRTATRALMFHAWAGPEASFRVEAMNGLSYAAMAEAAKTDPRIKTRVDHLLHGNVLAFYDLTRDESERRNEIDNPAFAAEVAQMKQQLLGYMERTQDPQLANYRKALAGQPIDLKMERLNRKKGE
jgi:N-sulfoglucosamine sulfohydrolase